MDKKLYDKLPSQIKFTNKSGKKFVLKKKPQPVKRKYYKRAIG